MGGATRERESLARANGACDSHVGSSGSYVRSGDGGGGLVVQY